jgi:hypothetical protein
VIRRLLAVVVIILVLSAGTVMTAAITVPESRAGLVLVTMEPGCTIPVSVTLSPSNMNRTSAAHHALTVTLTFSGGGPAGTPVTDITLRVAGGSGTALADPGGGPYVFTFSRPAVLALVGPVNDDFVVEVSGQSGGCTFSAEDTLKISGPIS